MAALLVTGNPGSGKTMLVRELVRRGLAAIDPDDDPLLSFWETDVGTYVSRVDAPAMPDARWLSAHRWVWSRSRLEEVLRRQRGDVFVCGIALNIAQVLDLFDRMFLLRIDGETQEARLLSFDRDEPPGRNEAGRQQIRDGRPVFEAQMLALGAIALDGGAQTRAVADQLLALASRPDARAARRRWRVVSAPDLSRGTHHQLQLAALFVLGQRIARHRGGKAALRAQ